MARLTNHAVKINLGSGTSLAPGWIGYDSSPNALLAKIPGLRRLLYWLRVIDQQHLNVSWPREIRVRNLARRKLPHASSSVDFIYSSHFFEHVSRAAADRLFRECYRVLRPNGVFRIAVPDLHANVKSYLSGYKRWSAADVENGPTPAEQFLEALNGLWTRPKRRSYHRYMYDDQSLTRALGSAGFRDIRRCGFRESKISDIHQVETRTDSLYVEAIKPGID